MRRIWTHPKDSTPTRRWLPWSPLQAATVLTCLLAASLAMAGPWSDPDFLPLEVELLMGSQTAPSFIDGVDGSSYCGTIGMRVLITSNLRVGYFIRGADHDYDGPLQDDLKPGAYDPELFNRVWGGYLEIGVTGRRLRPFLLLQGGQFECYVDYLFDRPGRDGYEQIWKESYNMFGAGAGLEYQIVKPLVNVRAEVVWNARAAVPDDHVWSIQMGLTLRMPKETAGSGDYFPSYYFPTGRRR